LSSVVDRIRRRRKYPVKLGDDTVFVRSMTIAENKAVEPFSAEIESLGYAIGVCLLNDDGSQVFAIGKDETANAFGARVLAELDIPDDARNIITEAIMKLRQDVPDMKAMETLVKNS
jgi:hypothetical protein